MKWLAEKKTESASSKKENALIAGISVTDFLRRCVLYVLRSLRWLSGHTTDDSKSQPSTPTVAQYVRAAVNRGLNSCQLTTLTAQGRSIVDNLGTGTATQVEVACACTCGLKGTIILPDSESCAATVTALLESLAIAHMSVRG